jgi:hypothetical protein
MEDNVLKRLSNRLADARSQGFRVRIEPLESQTATWCEIAGIPTLFVDLSQPAGEQLQQIDDALKSYHHEKRLGHLKPSAPNTVLPTQCSQHSVPNTVLPTQRSQQSVPNPMVS